MPRTTHRPTSRLGSRLAVEQLENRDNPSSGLADWTPPWTPPFSSTVATANFGAESVDSERFVTHLYQDVLGRNPEPSGLNLWVTALDNGTLSRGQAAIQFVASEEYRMNTIRTYFQAQLNRTPDAAELQFFMNRLRNGETQDALRVTFFGSEEFFNRYGRNNVEFVNQLYSQILGRTATAADVNFWVSVLAQTGGNRQFVATQFLNSREYQQLQVFGTYNLLLRRVPDNFGLNFWTQQRQSGMTIETMLVSFLASNEYYLRP
jgi:hypothetical protein